MSATMQVDPAIEALFGKDRSRVLGVLANSSTALSGYAISKLSGTQRIKVSSELSKLAAAAVVRAEGAGKVRRVWTLTDPGLRQFFSQRVRIISTDELEGRANRARLAKPRAVLWANRVDLTTLTPSRQVDLSEFRRARGKDLVLRQAGLRPARRST